MQGQASSFHLEGPKSNWLGECAQGTRRRQAGLKAEQPVLVSWVP